MKPYIQVWRKQNMDSSTGQSFFDEPETSIFQKPKIKIDQSPFDEIDFTRYEKTRVKRKVLGHVSKPD